MEALSVLPSLNKKQWDVITSNGVGIGKYDPLNWVVADNVLIQSVHNLNNVEQKLFEYFISLIDLKKTMLQFKIKKIDIIHFLFPETRNKKTTGFVHWYYSRLTKAFERILNSGVFIKFDNNKGELGLTRCIFLDHQNIEYIIVKFTHEIFPFLCYLKKNFTKYRIGYIEKLKGKYSICLYKYFSMKINIKESNRKILWQEDLKDLRFILDMKEKYKQFSDLKKRILDPSIKEINKNTDIQVEYDVIRGGVKNLQVISLEFTAKRKYQKTAIEKSKNKTQFSKEIFSNKQNSLKEDKAIPAAIHTAETVDTLKKTNIIIEEKGGKNGNIQVDNGYIPNNIANATNSIDDMDFQKIEKKKVPEKKTPFFKKVKKMFFLYKDM